MTVAGIDVSVWQASTPDLSGLSFLFARATYGTSPDARYSQHIGAAKAAGLVTGAYHFGVNADPAAQAAAFLAAAGSVDLYVLDLEDDGNRPRMTDDQARAFIAAVQAAGHQCGLYHSESGFPLLGQDWNWVAKWSATPPAIPWTFWQWQGSPLDSDTFAGSAAELAAFARSAGDGPMPTIVENLTGYTATVKVTANVRSSPRIRSDNYLRRGIATEETWVVVGKVEGDVDPETGSSRWFVRVVDGDWEYTADGNVPILTRPGPADCGPAIAAAVTAEYGRVTAGTTVDYTLRFPAAP